MNARFLIGDWLVEPELNTISKAGETRHLEPKVMQVLLQLASYPGQVLSKERLIELVWPDTFVSEDALTRCISVLRRETRDDPHTPRYIQTISKVGYRLVSEVQPIEEPSAEGNHVIPVQSRPAPNGTGHGGASTGVPAEERKTPDRTGSHRFVRLRMWQLATALFVLAAAATGLSIWLAHRSSKPSFRVISLTSYAGQQDQAAFSPSGSSIAFVWTSNNGNRNVFIKHVGSEAMLELTRGAESDYCPVWSPDGSQIAYLSSSHNGLGIYVVPALGGQPRKLYTPNAIVHWEQGALSWSPDGKELIFPDISSIRTPSSLYVLSLDTLRTRPVTSPPNGWDGDLNPVFSPDGRKIAFVRASDNAVRDIYVMPAPGGEPRQITRDGRIVDSIAWMPGSNSIVYSSDRGGKFALWKVSSRGGDPERLPVGVADAFQPAISGPTHRLLYTQSSATWSILRVPLQPRGTAGNPAPLLSSTEQDSAPSLAPDGTRFAFQSWRSGTQELWISSIEGTNLRQLTSDGGGLTGSPSFSPDGLQIAFDSRIDGHSHIFLMPAAGGSPRQLTFGDSNDIVPRWSVDGKSLFFASNRSGGWQSWKLSLPAGQLERVTTNGGYVAMESPDRRWIYFTKSDMSGLWRIPAGGGSEARVLSQPRGGYWGYWFVARRGIYVLDSDPPKPHIVFYDFATEKTATIATLDRYPPPYAGISVDENEKELLITDERNVGSHITLVENYP